jgi:hypothetical protein
MSKHKRQFLSLRLNNYMEIKMKLVKLSLILLGSISFANAGIYQCPQPKQINLKTGGESAGKPISLQIEAPKPFTSGQLNITLLGHTTTYGDILNHGDGTFAICCNFHSKTPEGQLTSASLCLNSKDMKNGTRDCKVNNEEGSPPSFVCKD